MCRGGLHVSARIVLFAICCAFPDRDAMACSDVEWRCPLDGKCILKEYVCDEYAPADCANGEDEQAEFCQTWKYPADVTATATPEATAIADTTTLSTTTATTTEDSGDSAHEDAGWGAGEKSQPEQQQECNQNDWKCPSDGTCIYVGFVCDYFDPPDCPDGDDEDEQLCSKWKGGTTTVTGTSTTTTVSTTTETQTTTTTSTVSTTTETTVTASTTTATTTTATTTTATTTTTLSTTSTTTTQPAGCCIIVLRNELSCIDRWTEIKCDALASRLLATGSRESATEFAAETACSNLPASCPHNSTTATTTTATSSGTTTTMTTTSRTTTTTTLAATGCCIIRSNDPELSCVDDFTAAECSSLETRMVAVGSISSTFLSLAVACKSLPTTCPQGSTTPTATTTTPLRGCCIVTSHDPQLICVDELSAAECSSLEKRMVSAGTTLALGAACVDLPAVCPQGSTTTTATSTTVSSTTRTSTTAPAGCCIVTSADPALSCFDNFTETNCAALESRIRKAGGGGSTSFAVANACKHFRDVCPQGTPAIRCSKSDGCSPPLKYCQTSEQLFNGRHQCVECSQQTFLANGGCTYRLTCKGPTYTQTHEKCTCRHAKEEGGGVEKNCHRCHVYKTERDQSYRARNVASSNNNHVAKYVKCYGCSNGFYFHNGSCIRRDSCLAQGMAPYDASGSGYRNYCDAPFTCYKKKRTNGPKAGEGCKCRRNWPLKRRCTRCDWGVSGVDYACTDP